jgi:DNA polymerase III subunit epsilon
MREIVFDTETTGLNPQAGDKIVEIGAVELVNHIPSGKTFQVYINPEKEMTEEVIRVHGITNEYLQDKPVFSEIADDFLNFIGDDGILVAHNASFDMNFINTELMNIGKQAISSDRVIDTLAIARKRFPGSRVSLNDLCKRFNVDLSARVFHGALLDSQLLAEVYLELLGGKEPSLVLKTQEDKQSSSASETTQKEKMSPLKEIHQPRLFDIPLEELKAHEEFVHKMKNPLWLKDENMSKSAE